MEIDITLGMFSRYKDTEKSGIINMKNIKDIQIYSWLSENEIKYIQNHYKKLNKKFEKRISKKEVN